MAKKKIEFDSTEVVLATVFKNDLGKETPKILNLPYDQFLKISFEPCEERKLFKNIPSEKIVLKLKKYAQPVEYTMMKNKEFYQEYKEGFRKFAQDNRIDLIDETK
ncbi:MAG: hypothetical protein E7399_00665 [Ruminococcaceae bacterium]|nr:hypothetical protein [Oscillospiraceae bacterium]